MPSAEELEAARGDAKKERDLGTPENILTQLNYIGERITGGAKAFLHKEYLYLAIWKCLFAIVLGVSVDWLEMSNLGHPTNFPYTATAYLCGSGTSIAAGYLGMRMAVFTNTRVTYQCCNDIHKGFITAFRGGQVLGFCLVGLALLVLMLIILIFRCTWYDGQLAQLIADAKIDYD